MDFQTYTRQFRLLAIQNGLSFNKIEEMLEYAGTLNRQNLPIIYNQEHFSYLCGIEYNFILGMSNSPESHYKRYLIPKRSGGMREIMEPLPTLKLVQEWILKEILYKIFPIKVSDTAKAFIPGRSIKDNVKFHRKKKTVVNIDLVDFFGSIKHRHLLNLFSSFGYKKDVAVLLANLCTLGGHLPQGSPTSPMLSNMMFRPVDDVIYTYCREHGIMYTRYADDLSFSGDFEVYPLLKFLHDTLLNNGFRINGKKTKILHTHQRQTVTNIVVNEKIQLRSDYRRKIRQNIHYIMKFGLESHLAHCNKKNNTQWERKSYLNHLRGQVNYALFINPKDEEMADYRRVLYQLT